MHVWCVGYENLPGYGACCSPPRTFASSGASRVSSSLHLFTKDKAELKSGLSRFPVASRQRPRRGSDQRARLSATWTFFPGLFRSVLSVVLHVPRLGWWCVQQRNNDAGPPETVLLFTRPVQSVNEALFPQTHGAVTISVSESLKDPLKSLREQAQKRI
jgi:hypothetical protein